MINSIGRAAKRKKEKEETDQRNYLLLNEPLPATHPLSSKWSQKFGCSAGCVKWSQQSVKALSYIAKKKGGGDPRSFYRAGSA